MSRTLPFPSVTLHQLRTLRKRSPNACALHGVISESKPVSTEDIPAFVPDWLPPEQQRTYYGTQINVEGFATD